MRLIRGLAGLRAPAARCVLTIGAYDGLHLGHQALLARLIERAAGAAAAGGAGDLRADAARVPAAAGSARAADQLARALAAARRRCRSTTCACCASMRLCVTCRLSSSRGSWRSGLDARTVVVGHDFRFGRQGAATAEVLAEAGRGSASRSRCVPPVRAGGRAHQQQRRARRAGARGLRARGRAGSGAPGRCAGAWWAGSAWDGSSGFRRPTCRCGSGARRSRACSRCACTASPRRRSPGVASLGTRPTVDGTRAAAGSAPVRLCRRPVRSRDRGGVRGEAARGGALRLTRGAHRADARGCGARRALLGV